MSGPRSMATRLLIVAALLSAPARGASAQGDGTFTWVSPATWVSPSAIPLPSYPSGGIAAGNFDRTGGLDLAVVFGSSSLAILLSHPTTPRTWLPRQDLLIGTTTSQVRAADLDGDGDDDLLVADWSTTGYVLWCNGDGTFGPIAALRDAASPGSLAVGDFDGDGTLDIVIVVAAGGGQAVRLLRGRADRSFELMADLPIAGWSYAAEVLDFDGDGQLDFVVGGWQVHFVLCRNLGGGTFDLPTRLTGPVDCSPWSLDTADFNADGAGDIVTVCGAALSLRDGRFEVPNPLLHSVEVIAPAAGDFDGDGRLDFAMTIRGNAIEVYAGFGDGTFAPPRRIQFGGVPKTEYFGRFVLAADLDGDRNDELVFTGPGNRLTVTWQPLTPLALAPATVARDMEIADLDQDGALDVFLPDATLPQTSVFLGPGLPGGLAKPPLPVSTAASRERIAVADFDGDGVPDLAGIASSSTDVRVVLLDTTGKARSGQNYPIGQTPRDVTAVRLFGDDLTDLVVVIDSWDLVVLNGVGGGDFGVRERVPSVFGVQRAAFADLDRDGRVDAAVFATTEVAIHWGDSHGSFEPAERLSLNAADRVKGMVVIDFDRDGQSDIVVSNTADPPGLRLYRGLGGRSFAEPRPIQSSVPVAAIIAADLDGDGWDEIVGSTPVGADDPRLVIGTTRGEVFSVRTMQIVEAANVLHLVDLDRDGVLDLVALGASGSAAMFLRGNPRPGSVFRRGDADADGQVQINDAVQVLSRLFLGGDALLCEDAADADDSGTLSLDDPIRLLSWLFLADDPPPAPGPTTCGPDVGADALTCAAACP